MSRKNHKLIDGKLLQMQGTAELIPAGTDEYFQVMDHKKLPHDAFDKMEQPMHLIKVTP